LKLRFGSLTEENVKEMCTWEYENLYDLYNLGSWDVLVKEADESIVDPIKRDENFLGFFDINDKLLGFVEFSYPKEGITRLGLGLNPESCGKSLGILFMGMIIDEVKKRNPENKIDLEVLTWNKRAFKVYQRSGFEIVETYERKTPSGIGEFHRMVYKS